MKCPPSLLLHPLIFWAACAHAEPLVPAGNEQVRRIMESYAGRGTLADGTPPTEAREAAQAFQVREGFAVDLMASEPEVQQPLYMNWDSQGRLWVVEYLQYQFPAGLKVISYDQHLRARFDRVPAPPPHGERGADRVVVFEDTDGDGFFDRHRTVLSGLNIATAALPGAGAIWVLNPPYLLRYPDADGDGVPDGDPEVAVRGFGLEDTHAVANSLQWGVDGWLYGAHGSTCTANVSSDATKNLRWEGQCIWRYHPGTRKIELYAEGGGNTFSLDIDAKGRVFSGTNGGGSRGMHYEQGSYGIKGWGKHGPLTNAHAYGWFEHMHHEGDKRRFPQAFVVYEGGLLGHALEGRILAPNALANLVYVSQRIPEGSTFRTRDEPELLTTSDRWFRPVDAKVGPDGALYLADWYDTRLSHVRPVDDWHKASGRIYRVRPKSSVPQTSAFNLHTAPPETLLAHLSHANRWFRRQAALEIGWRALGGLGPSLRAALLDPLNAYALDALFALDLLGGVDASLVNTLLQSADPDLRRWAVRITGEKGAAWSESLTALETLARHETHPEVRAQLFASAKRLPARTALGILQNGRLPFAEGETRLPLLAWWALESHCAADHSVVADFFQKDPGFTGHEFFVTHLARRLGQRLAVGGDPSTLESAARVWEGIRDKAARERFVGGVIQSLEGVVPGGISDSFAQVLQHQIQAENGGPVTAALRNSAPGALAPALRLLSDPKAPANDRLAVAHVLAERDHPESVPALLSILSSANAPSRLKRAALLAAARHPDAAVPRAVLSGYESRIAGDPQLRVTALRVLAGRAEWAALLIDAVNEWKIPVPHMVPEVVHLLSQHRAQSPAIAAALEQHWKGMFGALSPGDRLIESKRLRESLREASGSAEAGKPLFQQLCGSCHKLFGEGRDIGPELTGYERANADFWIDNLVYPSLEIREGFGSYTATTRTGQTFTGILESQSASGVVLRDLSGEKTRLRSVDLASLEASPFSLMPEGLLRGLNAGQVRDLFAYLMRPARDAESRR